MIGVINLLLNINKKCKKMSLPEKNEKELENYKGLYDDLEEKLYLMDKTLEYLREFETLKISNTQKAKIEDISRFYENLASIHEFVGKELRAQLVIFDVMDAIKNDELFLYETFKGFEK